MPTEEQTMQELVVPPRAGRREWTALAVLMLPLMLVSMDVSILYFAVPFIARDLRPTAVEQLWIFDVYGFVLAGLLLTMGAVGDRIGRRRLLLIGAACFGLASVAAAFAPTAPMLIAARAVLGVGGATLMPSTLALIRNLFHDERQRATAVSIWTGVTGGGIALGPVLSGLLLTHFWWGSVFLVNLPAMVLLLVLVPVLVPEFRPATTAGFDLRGSVLSLGAVLSVVWAVKELAANGVGLGRVAVLAAGICLGVAFWRVQRTSRAPMLDLALFRVRRFSGHLSANALAMFGLVGNAVFTTQFLQSVLDMSPLRAALWSVAPTVAVMAAAPAAMAAAQRVGRPAVTATGFAIATVGFVVLTRLHQAHGLPVVLLGAGLVAIGLVCVMTLAGETALAVAPPERAGSASAVLETSSELGGALGMALLGSVGAAVYRSRADASAGVPREAAQAVHDTLGGALAVAADLPGRLGGVVAADARSAFVAGMNTEAGVAAVLMLAAAAATVVLARRR